MHVRIREVDAVDALWSFAQCLASEEYWGESRACRLQTFLGLVLTSQDYNDCAGLRELES